MVDISILVMLYASDTVGYDRRIPKLSNPIHHSIGDMIIMTYT